MLKITLVRSTKLNVIAALLRIDVLSGYNLQIQCMLYTKDLACYLRLLQNKINFAAPRLGRHKLE